MTDALGLSYFISQVLSEIIDAKYQRSNKISTCTVFTIVFTDNKLYWNAHFTKMAGRHRQNHNWFCSL